MFTKLSFTLMWQAKMEEEKTQLININSSKTR